MTRHPSTVITALTDIFGRGHRLVKPNFVTKTVAPQLLEEETYTAYFRLEQTVSVVTQAVQLIDDIEEIRHKETLFSIIKYGVVRLVEPHGNPEKYITLTITQKPSEGNHQPTGPTPTDVLIGESQLRDISVNIRTLVNRLGRHGHLGLDSDSPYCIYRIKIHYSPNQLYRCSLLLRHKYTLQPTAQQYPNVRQHFDRHVVALAPPVTELVFINVVHGSLGPIPSFYLLHVSI